MGWCPLAAASAWSRASTLGCWERREVSLTAMPAEAAVLPHRCVRDARAVPFARCLSQILPTEQELGVGNRHHQLAGAHVIWTLLCMEP